MMNWLVVVFGLLNFGAIFATISAFSSPSPSSVEHYDFIIVGAGSAGCVLANRLSEIGDWRILLLEAGFVETPNLDIPIAASLVDPLFLWSYTPERGEGYCLGYNDNRCPTLRGKVMGGTGSINYLIYTRGGRKDFDTWRDLGNPGWGFQDVLPYFQKLENSQIPDRKPGWAGVKGPVTISYPRWRSTIAKAFMGAGKELGASRVDYNTDNQEGFSYIQANAKNGWRHSSNQAYLTPINRPNLTIKIKSTVSKLLINNRTNAAYGVQYSSFGQSFTAIASREVILSAGAFESAKLLMLAGIGPADHLRDVGVEPILDLPVGQTLVDHFGTTGLPLTSAVPSLNPSTVFSPNNVIDFLFNGNGVLTSTAGAESVAFFDTDGFNDYELVLLAGTATGRRYLELYKFNVTIHDRFLRRLKPEAMNRFSISVTVLHPRSRGRLLLKSTDPDEEPRIFQNFYSDPQDVAVAVKGLRKVQQLLATSAFRAIKAKIYDEKLMECAQWPDNSDAYLECYVRHFTFSANHHIGSCRMGPAGDPEAVVDARLRVHGMHGLRVVDAGVIPMQVTGHPNGAVMMIAEKAADMIKEEWKRPTSFKKPSRTKM